MRGFWRRIRPRRGERRRARMMPRPLVGAQSGGEPGFTSLACDGARGVALPDGRLLIALRLPHLNGEIDQRDQHRDGADQTADGSEIGEGHGLHRSPSLAKSENSKHEVEHGHGPERRGVWLPHAAFARQSRISEARRTSPLRTELRDDICRRKGSCHSLS